MKINLLRFQLWVKLIRNGNQVYKIPLDPGEVIMLRTFLTLALTKLFEVRLKKTTRVSKATTKQVKKKKNSNS